MKRLIVFAIICSLSITLFYNGSFARAEVYATEDEVISICKNVVTKEGVSSDELQAYQSSAQSYIISTNGIITKKWLVSFQESSSLDANFGFAIFIEPTDIIQTANRSKVVFYIAKQRLEWEVDKGLFEFWSVEDKAAFNQKILTPLGYPGSATLPGDSDVTETEALNASKKALRERFGLSDEQIGHFLIDRSFFALNQKPSWVICYRENSQSKQHFFRIVCSVVIDASNSDILAIAAYE